MTKESSPKRKQLVKVRGYGSDMYGSYKTRFSLITHPDEGRKQVGHFLPCRDHINDSLRNFIHKRTADSSIYSYGQNPPIDMDRLRLLIGKSFDDEGSREIFKNNIFSAKRLLNFYEKVAGWKQSKITTVNHSKMKYNVWLVSGPKEWLSYSQLTSMVTLIFRIIGHYGPIEFSNNEDIERWFYNLMEQYREEIKSGIYEQSCDLGSYLPHCWDKFYMVMKHNKEIFTQPIKTAYPAEGEFHAYGGITQLCKFHTLNKTLDENMKRIYSCFIESKYRNFIKDGTTHKIYEEYQERKQKEKKLSEEKLSNIIINLRSL